MRADAARMSCARRVASTSVSIQRIAPGIAPAGHQSGDRFQVGIGDARIDQRAGQHPRVGDAAAVEPLAHGLFTSTAAQRVEDRRRTLSKRFGQGAQRAQ